jgi:hypothetical protein
VLAARAAIARPEEIGQLNRSNLFRNELTCDTSTINQTKNLQT